jgi:hypothetical protein
LVEEKEADFLGGTCWSNFIAERVDLSVGVRRCDSQEGDQARLGIESNVEKKLPYFQIMRDLL